MPLCPVKIGLGAVTFFTHRRAGFSFVYCALCIMTDISEDIEGGTAGVDREEIEQNSTAEAKTTEAETKTAKAGKAKAKAGAADGTKSVITSLYSSAELKKAMGDGAGADSKAGADSDDDAAASVSIIVYKTSWCGACKQIQPLFEKLATEHPEVAAFSVMIDGSSQTKKIGQFQGIGSYPVFDVYVGGERKERIMGMLAGFVSIRSFIRVGAGADAGKLEKAFDKFGGSGSKKKRGGRRR